jgi:hypothetical protein
MPTPSAPSDPKAAAEIPVSFEENLKQAWARYGNAIYVMCGLVAAGILAKGGWDYLVAQKELGIRKDFAACTSTETFRAFASYHPGHPLAGMADLRVADDAYATGHYADSAAGYEKAVAELPASPFQARARIGLAMAQAQSGRVTDAETGLRQLLNDSNQLKAVRCEAGFHLAGLAVGAGRAAEVQKLAEQLMQIDPTSPFAERTFALRSEMPEPAAAAPSAGAITVPGKN